MAFTKWFLVALVILVQSLRDADSSENNIENSKTDLQDLTSDDYTDNGKDYSATDEVGSGDYDYKDEENYDINKPDEEKGENKNAVPNEAVEYTDNDYKDFNDTAYGDYADVDKSSSVESVIEGDYNSNNSGNQDKDLENISSVATPRQNNKRRQLIRRKIPGIQKNRRNQLRRRNRPLRRRVSARRRLTAPRKQQALNNGQAGMATPNRKVVVPIRQASADGPSIISRQVVQNGPPVLNRRAAVKRRQRLNTANKSNNGSNKIRRRTNRRSRNKNFNGQKRSVRRNRRRRT